MCATLVLKLIPLALVSVAAVDSSKLLSKQPPLPSAKKAKDPYAAADGQLEVQREDWRSQGVTAAMDEIRKIIHPIQAETYGSETHASELAEDNSLGLPAQEALRIYKAKREAAEDEIRRIKQRKAEDAASRIKQKKAEDAAKASDLWQAHGAMTKVEEVTYGAGALSSEVESDESPSWLERLKEFFTPTMVNSIKAIGQASSTIIPKNTMKSSEATMEAKVGIQPPVAWPDSKSEHEKKILRSAQKIVAEKLTSKS